MFKFEFISPGQLDVDQVRFELLNALRRNGTIVKTEFESTIETWEGGANCVKFKATSPSLAGGDPSITVGPVSGDIVPDRGGSVTYLDVWNWLNNGTSVRHAVLAPNFRRKTTPGTIRAHGGERAAWKRVSVRFNFPGQEARNWDMLIAEKTAPVCAKNLVDAMRRGLRKMVAQANAGARVR